jgi:predicted RNA methylase
MPNEIDFSNPTSDLKTGRNLQSLTADSNVKRILFGSAVVDVANLVDGAGATGSITVTGAALGDIVLGVSADEDLVDMVVTAYVQAANTVEFRVQNESGSTVNLATTTVWRALVADVT